MKKNEVDLVLVHPGNKTRIYQSLGKELSAVEPPVWAGLIATFVRNKGFSVVIIDSEVENLSPEEVATRVETMNPLLTGIVVYGHQPSASTQNMTVAGEISVCIKQANPERKVIMIGGHVAALPERTMKEESCDFVAGGEGLYTVSELLQALKTGSTQWEKVQGLWYRNNGAVLSNPVPPLIMNLDQEMGGIAWDLIPMQKYRAHNWHCFGDLQREPYGALYTTLGCPYHCTFCCIQAPFKNGEKKIGMKESINSYRYWSPQTIIAEIDRLVNNYGVRNLRISDEMFVLNMKHVHTICDLIVERGYRLNIWAYARVDTIKSDLTLEKLKKAGCNWLAFGIESASEKVRDDVDKGYKQDDIFKTIDRVQKAGINIIANYIFGLPEDDNESMQETLDQALQLNCEFANFYCCMAYPGSDLYRTAVENKWELPKKWSGYSQHSVDMLPLRTKHCSVSEVIRFRDQAWQTYFTSPKYLSMIEKKFGNETLRHIQEMTSHQLVREHA